MVSYKKSISPLQLKELLPASRNALDNVESSRSVLSNIFDKNDNRLIMIVGPCSFHDPKACFEYSKRLKLLAKIVLPMIYIVMRVYLEKPRTNLGWKGYINDPALNNTYCIEKGFYNSRKYMLDLCEMGMPIATEILTPYSYLYFEDLLSWGAIGARTSESQPHREIASGLPMPIGFKNGTDGGVESAINGISFSSRPQVFLGMNLDGRISILHTQGNPYGHLVLRGSDKKQNYCKEDIAKAEEGLCKLNLPASLIIDCSHGNSSGDPDRQIDVLNEVISQRNLGNDSIRGVMMESFLENGNQSIPTNISQLHYGQSITDACVGWKNTERMIIRIYESLEKADIARKSSHRPSSNVYIENFSMNL